MPENVLTSGMASYVKKKQEVILTEDEVRSIVEQIENNRFSKSWRTNRAHKAYLKDKHSSNSKNSTSKPLSALQSKDEVEVSHRQKVSTKPNKTDTLQSREVAGWSGQTVKADEPFIVPTAIEEEVFYITPFELPVSEAQIDTKTEINTVVATKTIENTVVTDSVVICPKCQSEMIKRVAKKGVRQGQIFYGCSQFPKCRSVINAE